MIRIGVRSFVSAGGDADAQAFITAAGITDATQQSAINTLVIDLKGYGVWTKMRAIYPFVGGTASTHKWNLKDPRDLDAAFRLVFFGGGSHGTGGWTPNGTNGYADTFMVQSTVFNANSNHVSAYSRTNIASGTTPYFMGVTNATTHGFQILSARNSLGNFLYENGSQVISLSNTNTTGFYLGTSTSSTSAKSYKNGVNVGTSTTSQIRTMFATSVLLSVAKKSDGTIFGGYDNKQLAFASLGDGLTDTEASNLYTAVQAYQTTLSRNV